MAFWSNITNGESGASVRSKLNALGTGAVKNNFSAMADPTVSDDADDDYAVGSIWQRSDTGISWRCRDATVGAAKWVRQDLADHPGYVSGNWYQPVIQVQSNGSAVTANSIRLIPFPLKERVTISALGTRVNTTSAGGYFHLALYASDPTTKKPTGAPVATTGFTSASGLSTGTATTVSAAISGGNVTLEPGIYWMAVICDNATATFMAVPATNSMAAYMFGSPSHSTIANSGGAHLALTFAHTAGTAWPNLTGATLPEAGTTPTNAALQFKVA